MRNVFEHERVARLANGAHYLEDKVGVGTISLREFVVRFLSYKPGWMKVLWRVRVGLLRVLGQGERDIPQEASFTERTLPVEPGQKAEFFTVVDSDGETYWFAEANESHLGGVIGVVVEPGEESGGIKRFHLITIVRYNNWAGPLYFNLIRPFHHLVVNCFMRSALGGNNASEK